MTRLGGPGMPAAVVADVGGQVGADGGERGHHAERQAAAPGAARADDRTGPVRWLAYLADAAAGHFVRWTTAQGQAVSARDTAAYPSQPPAATAVSAFSLQVFEDSGSLDLLWEV